MINSHWCEKLPVPLTFIMSQDLTLSSPLCMTNVLDWYIKLKTMPQQLLRNDNKVYKSINLPQANIIFYQFRVGLVYYARLFCVFSYLPIFRYLYAIYLLLFTCGSADFKLHQMCIFRKTILPAPVLLVTFLKQNFRLMDSADLAGTPSACLYAGHPACRVFITNAASQLTL